MRATFDRDPGGSAAVGSGISLRRAADLVFGSPRFLLPAALITLLTMLTSVLSSLGSAVAFLSLLLTVPVLGYQLGIARGVLLGDTALPAALDVVSAVRRGSSATLIAAAFMIPMGVVYAVASLTLVLGVSTLASLDVFASLLVALTTVGYVLVGLIALATLLVVFMGIMPAIARYAAFDRLREGLRFGDAWRRFWRHRRPGLQFYGIELVAATMLVALRFAAQAVSGLNSTKARAAAIAQLSHGPHRAGLALLGIDLVAAILSALWQLVVGALLGQYLAIAFPREPSVTAESDLTSAST